MNRSDSSASASHAPDSAELHSADWYRVGGLRLRLRPGVSVSRQVVRGMVWHVLTDPSTGRQHRFNEPAYRLIAALDGNRSLDAIWRGLLAQDGDAAPTQPEAIRVVSQAYAAKLLLGQVVGDARGIVKAQRKERQRRDRAAANPLAFRLSLWNPDAFLDRTVDYVRPLCGPKARAVGWLIAFVGLCLLMANGEALARDASLHVGSVRLMMAMWLAWPLLKGLHELAHAFMVKVHGGTVNEIGVTLMVLTPLPYVDATASASFADKRHRVAVAAAGILCEAVLSTAALAAWLVLEPGMLREICLAVVLVGGVSTLLVNGNPLMRYDGYHVLADALELPNLASRSLRWWKTLLQRVLLRQPQARMDDLSPGEKPWLVAYAPLSWIWRIVLLAVLSLALSAWSVLLGLGLMAAAAWMAVAGPIWRVARWLWRSPEATGVRGRGAIALSAAAVAGLLVLFALPMNDRTQAPGIVWLPDDAFVRLQSDARIEHFLVEDGAQVQAGTPLVRLSNEELLADLARVRGQWRTAQIERLQRFDSDAARVAVAEDEIRRLASETQRLQQLADQLTLRAAIAGRVVIQEPQRMIGRWLSQGETVAQVLPPGAARVRALVRNEDVARVRQQPGVIAVQLAHNRQPAVSATLERGIPRSSRELPSAALGEHAGGPLSTDPADRTGRTAQESRFSFDLRLPEGVEARVGTRTWVTFDHGATVAADVLLRVWRETFLRHFAR